MVIIESLTPIIENVTSCEIQMDSGKRVTYVAPAEYGSLHALLENPDNSGHLKLIGQNQGRF